VFKVFPKREASVWEMPREVALRTTSVGLLVEVKDGLMFYSDGRGKEKGGEKYGR